MQDLNAFQRFWLALRCFFLVLLARRLPEEAVAFLPPAALVPKLPPPSEKPALAAPLAKPAEPPAPVQAPAPVIDVERVAERGAIRLLALLQREGRLVDFLEESIDQYDDAQIGAAVRDIHRGCKKALDEYLNLGPVLPQPEESTVRVEPGFDASRIRLVGEVMGQPPFFGTLRHPGWIAESVRLPALADGHDTRVVAPAEVELGSGGA